MLRRPAESSVPASGARRRRTAGGRSPAHPRGFGCEAEPPGDAGGRHSKRPAHPEHYTQALRGALITPYKPPRSPTTKLCWQCRPRTQESNALCAQLDPRRRGYPSRRAHRLFGHRRYCGFRAGLRHVPQARGVAERVALLGPLALAWPRNPWNRKAGNLILDTVTAWTPKSV